MTEVRNVKTAARLGAMNRCPKCGKGRMFDGYLQVVSKCDSCGEPLGEYPAADGPAFFTITIVMLLLIPIIGFGWVLFRPDPVTLSLVIGVLITVLTLALLRYVKGAFVGYLWANHEKDRGA
ncbi:DUF983 domain-containing protein [Paracoccus fistulariae]|uniref:DUF983 domain-containing protein n=1 Tax=Paracoccus fistulariae TaxID=658446 RepID=A0ABY7SP11_9RHOB|nr:DUF983 domain-containing protein [Paracoccus fistulariae]MDB6182280.1 DUF983 domain-containing protein [Paracoccus fistulariae]WCR08735.1 DUF983 domain-containing protein [Paracoccus fistulariae]